MSETTSNRPPGRDDETRPDGASRGRRTTRRVSRPRSTYRTTVYRVHADLESLATVLNHRYLRANDFTTMTTEVAGAPALLVHGHVPQPVADWCPVVTGLTGDTMTVSHSSAGCVLLIAVDDQVYALTYGTIGRFMIDPERIDPGFGIAFAIRAIEPEQIRRVTRRVLASTGRVERSLVPGGQHIRRYSIEGWGEIVGQLSGHLTNTQLTVARGSARPVSIAGAESLQIAVSTDPAGLLDDLREISRVCARESPSPDLEFIAQVRPIHPGDSTARLDVLLDGLLGSYGHPDLGLAVPASQIEYEASAQSYVIKVPYRAERTPDLDLDTILERTRGRPAGRRLEALKIGSIGMCADSDGRELLTPAVAAHKWITAEISLGAARMIYHEGRWYEIGVEHLAILRAEIEQILTRTPTIALPPWTGDLANEDAYNRMVAEQGTGYVLLDKHFLKTRQHRRGPGIEACDLLGPANELIHVKRAERSAPLSHLFAQGEVSVDALIHEAEARERLVAQVHAERPGHPIDTTFRPRKVVYAIALGEGNRLTADTLFTFSQVALYRTVRRLRGDNVDVEVVSIRT
ncbi:TIGR04141 family sporadically distributed protein [Micromonospora sp. CPCC 205371]|nr:TIGR04141 family sporadically distributed protein [Micromonospora sp. CPCC 205371]